MASAPSSSFNLSSLTPSFFSLSPPFTLSYPVDADDQSAPSRRKTL